MANQDEVVSFEAPNATTLALPFPCVNSVRYRPRTQDHLGGLATWEYNKGMVDMECRCVAILEPWNQARFVHPMSSFPRSLHDDYFRSKHPASEKIIKKVHEDFARFFDVLEKSKDIARNGRKAMEDIAYTCS